MARQRSPQSIEAEKMHKDGMLLVDIAAKLGVPASTVRRWKSDQNWNGSKSKPSKKNNPSARNDKPSARKPRGAPKGNKNAVGNSGGPPLGSQNALKHGGYSAIFWDTLAEDEREMIETMEYDGEKLLVDEIALLTVRERRIMQSISKYKDAKGGQAVSSVYRSESKRDFKSEEDKLLYEERQREKIEGEKLLPGNAYQLSTTTEATYNIVQRLEEALTRCQAQKQRSIDALCRLRQQGDSGKGSELVDDWIAGVMGGDEIAKDEE